jgi:signal transduction histidine kinase
MARRKTLVTYLIAYFFTIGTAFRYLSLGRNEPHRWTATVQRTIAGLFIAFFLLLVIEPWLTRRSHRHTHAYLAVQTAIISAISLITPGVDYFSALFLSLAVQAMYVFPLRTGSRWVGAFTVIMTTLMLYGHPLSKGLPLVIIMSVAYLFIGSYAAVTREAEAAREESQRLLAELQEAHEQLQSYAAQAEELAVAAERRRAQEALEAAHAFQQSIMDGVTEPIMVIDLDYQVELMNRAAREFSSEGGGTSQPLLCYRISRHREMPCNGVEYPCPLEQVRELGQPVTVVHDHYQANGERRFNEVIASPLWGEDGTFQGIIESVRDITERIQAEEALQQYAQRFRALAVQLAEVAEAERQTLARELHDRVGQNLTALGINLNIVRAQMPEETAAAVRSRLDDSLSLVEQTTERIRDVMANLRPPVLDDYGLMAALQWYGEQFARRTGIAVAVEGEEPAPRLAAHVENALFRIAQEALTNVAKHAHATHASVTVELDGGTLRLIVADDGTGFDPAHLAEPNEGQGWGLLTMAERAEAANGRCCIESTPGQGTQVLVEVTR